MSFRFVSTYTGTLVDVLQIEDTWLTNQINAAPKYLFRYLPFYCIYGTVPLLISHLQSHSIVCGQSDQPPPAEPKEALSIPADP